MHSAAHPTYIPEESEEKLSTFSSPIFQQPTPFPAAALYAKSLRSPSNARLLTHPSLFTAPSLLTLLLPRLSLPRGLIPRPRPSSCYSWQPHRSAGRARLRAGFCVGVFFGGRRIPETRAQAASGICAHIPILCCVCVCVCVCVHIQGGRG